MKEAIPKWQERQKLLYLKGHKGDPAKLTELGNRCLQKGYIQDAFEYFWIAGHEEGLKKIEQIALEEGDAFLYEALGKAGREFSKEEWNQIGYRAFESGKYRFAAKAFEKTENEIMLAKIRATVGETTPAENGTDDPEPE